MKKRKVSISTLLTLTVALLFAACGQKNVADQTTDATVFSTSPVAFVPQTETEYRQEIAKLQGDASAADTLQEYYEQLLAMDVFTEEDYVALAAIYAEQGRQEQQADMLTRVHKLYPSMEYVEALSELIWKKDSSDTETANLIGQLMELLHAEDAQGISLLVASEEWQSAMQSELVGVVTRTVYTDGNQTVQISSDTFATDILCLSGSGELLSYEGDMQGDRIVKGTWADGSYQGAFSMSNFDAEHSLLSSFHGTMQENICVEELQINYEGTEYTGHFDEQGGTTEEQLAEVNGDGGVIYAYSHSGNQYLYMDNSTVDVFRIDADYLGMPVFEAW